MEVHVVKTKETFKLSCDFLTKCRCRSRKKKTQTLLAAACLPQHAAPDRRGKQTFGWMDEVVCTCAKKFVHASQSCENVDKSRCHFDGSLLRRGWNNCMKSATKGLSWQTRGWRSWPFNRLVWFANETMMQTRIYKENANRFALTTHCPSVALSVWASWLFQSVVFQTSCI